MSYNIFIDGSVGTTGLKILERLEKRPDISLITLPEEKRKDTASRKEAINSSDVTFLCLPDAAAVEAVSLAESQTTVIIDASTAHRTENGWSYGFPELSKEHREEIKTSKRIANPGCHASGFAAIVYPLVKSGILPSDYPISATSVTGYSGGGKPMIQDYSENAKDNIHMESPRFYALSLSHKHLPEMKKVCGLDFNPLFTPVVGNFYNGMLVSVPILNRTLPKKQSAKELHAFLADYYRNEHFVRVLPFAGDGCLESGFLPATGCNDTNFLDLLIFGNDEQTAIIARLDNLGKGASGAAVQNMNLALGLDETTSL